MGAHSPARLDPLGRNRQALIEILSWEIPVGASSTHEFIEFVDIPVASRDLGDELLDQDVERCLRRQQGVETTRVNRREQRTTLDEVVTCLWKQTTLGSAVSVVIRSPDALEEGGDVAWRRELAHEIYRTDIDPELQRCGCNERLEVAGSQALLYQRAAIFRQAAVVGCHEGFGASVSRLHTTKPLGELL